MARKWRRMSGQQMKIAAEGLHHRSGSAIYSGNFLGGTPSRGTEPYADWQGLALESEFLPDSPNHPEWPQPDCFLRPGEEYSSLTEYQFIAE